MGAGIGQGASPDSFVLLFCFLRFNKPLTVAHPSFQGSPIPIDLFGLPHCLVQSPKCSALQ